MKTFRAKAGPFAERPFYELADIEDMCSDELRRADLYPSDPSPVRIERFVERRFCTPSYDDLPESVLGFTKFGSKGVEAIVVSKTLVEDPGKVSQRRVNTTLAHEAGHALLHTYLFAQTANLLSLFENQVDPTSPRILCRNDTVMAETARRSYDGRWWEYQANLTIGPLLLPAVLVRKYLEPRMVRTGALGTLRLPSASRDLAVRDLAAVFEVNPIVAKIRLNQLMPLEDEAQLTL
jgi:hypothetical protein